jgi:hypothetical protein
MRKWAALLLFAGMAESLWAAKSMSVEQLEQLLAANQGKADAHVAQVLADVELIERMTPERLAKWEKNFPGDREHEALIRLADMAAFLNPPPADVLRIAPPDGDTQERMLALANDYVKTTIARLPDFSTTRATIHFEDAPSQEQISGPVPAPSAWWMHPLGVSLGRSEAKPLHSTGATSATVMYRGGNEVLVNAEAGSVTRGAPPPGSTANGEFGALLNIVLGDATRGVVTWGRWEPTTGDPIAVLHYAVPQDQSNYAVEIANGKKMDTVYPAYQGEIAIDPATGSILRVSLVAEMPGLYESLRSALLVEYGPVAIGDQTLICPARAVSYSKAPVAGSTLDTQNGTVMVQTQMSDVTYTQYHVLGSQAQIDSDGKRQSATKPEADLPSH